MELKEKVEQVCLKYAQETDWDFEKLNDFINGCLVYDEFDMLPGEYSWDKAKVLFNVHKPEVNVDKEAEQARSKWFNQTYNG